MQSEISNKSMFFYILMYWTWKKDDTSILPEVLYMWDDLDRVVDFLKIFGGTTIKVPTIKELNLEMRESMLAYLVYEKGESVQKARLDLKISENQYNNMKSRIAEWELYYKSNFKNGGADSE